MPTSDEGVYECPQCGAESTGQIARCPVCGAGDSAASTHATEPAETPARPRLLDNRWAMLGMLFGVTAALGIPILWASRAFSPRGKAVLSVVVTIYTILLLWGFWLIMCWAVARIMNSM